MLLACSSTFDNYKLRLSAYMRNKQCSALGLLEVFVVTIAAIYSTLVQLHYRYVQYNKQMTEIQWHWCLAIMLCYIIKLPVYTFC
jgi:hypothetical protein